MALPKVGAGNLQGEADPAKVEAAKAAVPPVAPPTPPPAPPKAVEPKVVKSNEKADGEPC